MTLQEAKLAAAQKRMAEAQASHEELRRLRHATEVELLRSEAMTGADLRAYCAWQLDMKRQLEASEASLQEARTAFTQQLHSVQAAKRDVRLLERLREKRFEEWEESYEREIEELAANSVLARWKVE